MMKRILSISILFTLVLYFTGCEDDRIRFDTDLKIVGFERGTINVPEEDSIGRVAHIYFGAVAGTPPVTVTIEVDTSGHSNPAIEGVDYTLSTKELSLEVGNNPITITGIDNDEFTGDKTFTLRLVVDDPSVTLTVQRSLVVTIIDDEHPLKNWLGEYTVNAISYDGPGTFDEIWDVNISPVEGNLTQVSILGVAGSENAVIATIDSDELTITVAPGQPLGVVYGATYGEVGVYWGGVAKATTWSTPSAEVYEEAGQVLIEGTVSADGATFLIDDWAHLLTGNNGFIYDVFNTTWTKK